MTKIKIKNVTGSQTNEGLIWELSRAGFPEGSIIENAHYRSSNNSVEWSSGSFDCTAWVGETCEILDDDKIDKTNNNEALSINMTIISQLSDAQEELAFNIHEANTRLNFVKYILINYPDTNVMIDRKELDRLWNGFEKAYSHNRG